MAVTFRNSPGDRDNEGGTTIRGEIEDRTQAGRFRRLGLLLAAALVALAVVISGCGGGSAGPDTTSKPASQSGLDQHKDNPSSKSGSAGQAVHADAAANSLSQHKDNPTRVRDGQDHDSGGSVGEHKDNPTSKKSN